MDVLFFLQHSPNNDTEIRHALRSIAAHMPWARKVWIFGDRPVFLSSDTSLIEHVPHEATAWIGRYQTPVRNFFLMYWLSSLIPGLGEEYLRFSDDFILLDDLTPELARRVRVLEDLAAIKTRGRGLWKDGLWRTYDTLKRLGYPTWNFETHTPAYFQKKWVFEAFRDLGGFATEDLWFGLTGATAILNHACKQENLPLVSLPKEGTRAGFYGKPPTRQEIIEGTRDRLILNFDDAAFGDGIRTFLAERFPNRCKYESDEDSSPAPGRPGGDYVIVNGKTP